MGTYVICCRKKDNAQELSMEVKRQPRRIAKTKSLETTFDDDDDSDIDEVQRKLDRLLGDDSDGSDKEYNPVIDDLATSDENDLNKKEEAAKNNAEDPKVTAKKNKRLSKRTNNNGNYKKAKIKSNTKKVGRPRKKIDVAENLSDQIEVVGALSKTDEVTSNNEEDVEDSDDSFIQQIRDSYRQKIKQRSSGKSSLNKPDSVDQRNTKKVGRPRKKIDVAKTKSFLYMNVDALKCDRPVLVSDLRTIPSLMRTILGCHNPYNFDENFKVRRNVNHLFEGTRFFTLNIAQMEFERLLNGDSQECLSYLVSLLNMPTTFWSMQNNLKTSEMFDPMVEEAGMMTFRLLQRIISNSSLYAQTVLKFGKIADGFRNKSVVTRCKKKIVPVLLLDWLD